MKRILLFLSLLPAACIAQNFHFSGRLGMAGYQGDLKAKSISFSQSTLLGSIGAKYDLSEHIALRSYLTLTSLRGDDKKGTAVMRDRNLNFHTSILDWEGGVQYSFFDLNEKWWTPYAFAGIGFFHFNPYTKDTTGAKAFLHPLTTEGQGLAGGAKKYSLMQFSIPLGIGAERMLNEDMRVGLEMGYRKIFTDYLDDVSDVYIDEAALLAGRGPRAVDLAYRGDEVGKGPYPAAGATRGSPKYKDGYFYMALTFTYRFYFDKYKEIAGLPSSKRGKKVGCPATRY
jgi:Outer membrane protein beta-barrel domain